MERALQVACDVGAFVVVSHFASTGERYVTLEDYAGLGRRSPALAAILTIFLLSLIGIPATGGFFAKFYVFSAALKAMQALRTEHQADMKAWYDRYGSDRQSAEAQAALQQLRAILNALAWRDAQSLRIDARR